MTDRSRLLKVLYLDHEGGWGGASRSLWYLLSSLDRSAISPEVWHRQIGPAIDRFNGAGILSSVVPAIPNLTPRAGSHPANWILNARELLGMNRLARKMIATKADIFHFNYEGTAPVALALKYLGDTRPRVLHIRVMHPRKAITRLFVRHLVPLFDHIIFITENERDRLVECGYGLNNPHSVLYNPIDARLLGGETSPPPSSGTFRVSFFGTLDALRGADRLIEVGRILKSKGISAEIELFGRGPRYRRFLFFKRKDEGCLQAAIEGAGVAGFVRLRGHSAVPEIEIAKSHIVVRPSRGSDPWGRDIIETMSLGRPVIATGSFDGFVSPGETGYLIEPWDSMQVADIIETLATQPAIAAQLGSAAKARARRLFDPALYASHVTQIYREVLNN